MGVANAASTAPENEKGSNQCQVAQEQHRHAKTSAGSIMHVQKTADGEVREWPLQERGRQPPIHGPGRKLHGGEGVRSCGMNLPVTVHTQLTSESPHFVGEPE